MAERSPGAFSTADTIVAVATPPGRGAIGVIRLSGPRAADIAGVLLGLTERLRGRRATFGRVRPDRTAVGDEVIATYFPSPRSYTGEDVVELSAHGNPLVLEGIVEAAIAEGARLARPGEFTLRSFLNGKRDLIQAEAVGDLISAVTPLQARAAFDQLRGTLTTRIASIDAHIYDLVIQLEASLDFPEEGYHFVDRAAAIRVVSHAISEMNELIANGRRGRVLRDGARVVISGRTNAGKSLLFNRLVGHDRSIVSTSEGTTRDMVSELVSLNGLPVMLVDTAGTRRAQDPIEVEGINRGTRAREVADLVLVVLDSSEPLAREDVQLLEEVPGNLRLVVGNKTDRVAAWSVLPSGEQPLMVSALRGDGLEVLREAIVSHLTGTESRHEPVVITNLRHIVLLERAVDHLSRARGSLAGATPEEFVLTDLQAAMGELQEVSGPRAHGDVLAQIFERFCVGK